MWFDDNQEDNFYDSIINVARKLWENKNVIVAEDFNGHAGSNLQDYEDQNGGCSYGV